MRVSPELGPHAGVMQLDHGDGVVSLDAGGQSLQPLGMLVPERAELAWKALPDGLDVRRAGHRKAETAACAHREPVIFIVGQSAVRVALEIRERCEHESILHVRSALEGERVVGGNAFVGHRGQLSPG